MRKVALCALVLAALDVAAQSSYSPDDVAIGARFYRSNCASCHGATGDVIAGVDLGHGKFRQAKTDEDLVRIITKGIPGTPMPPANLTLFQAGAIVAYLRDTAAEAVRNTSSGGDAARGKLVFEGKGECLSCHRVSGAGSRLGPDLSDVGSLRRSAELETAVVDPSADVLPQHRSVRIVTQDGTILTGRLLNHDVFGVQLLDSREQLVSLSKSTLRTFEVLSTSTMPSYRDKLTPQELKDLVAYMVSLKGVLKP
jgi:cytochrome c oxidase cbb3-type subunit III